MELGVEKRNGDINIVEVSEGRSGKLKAIVENKK